MKSVLNEHEAAEYLGLSYSHTNLMRRRGEGPTHFALGNRIRYRLVDLEEWIEKRLVRAA
jgi:excisionase family DNA binding protein